MSFRISALLTGPLCAASLAWACGAWAQAPAGGQGQVYSTSAGGQAPAARSVSSGAAADPAAQAVKERFEQRFTELSVTAVRRTPYGLFEVQIGSDLIYTDEKVTWVMEGPLIDAMTRRDVTRERQEKLGSVSFDELPLDLAVKQVRGDGSRKIAIFEDPNCGYCKQLHKTLRGVDNLTIYTFLYPILAPDSHTKSRDIWCAANPAQAWQDWMLDGKTPATAECETPVQQVLALGQKLMVRGTPAIFFQDGSRLNGAAPLEMIQARLGQ
ncbi:MULTISPECIES: DsbC family protein [Bordetella]|uniref:Thiol:disulfide interchange protein n=2 Tax=Bordetella TaxID=517 RepID=A0A261W873_9BORD|nr:MULTISPECIES: DsbC family protein [Bordetella]MDM9558372.1 DsbC family protein [Bordetella petrii]OZI82558.1 disulfide bond formation protein DsbC [Bordetella genomosp. 2]